MARRRVGEAGVSAVSAVPERLCCCVVEDWVLPGERPEEWWFDGSAKRDRATELREWQMIVARRRFGDAGREWASAHGVDWRELPSPGRPVFRDRVAWRRAVIDERQV